MNKLKLLAPIAATVASSAAFAGPQPTIDVYYIPSSDFEISDGGLSGETDGTGFGIRGMAPVADTVFVTGEYQSVDYDDLDDELVQVRAGIGAVLAKQEQIAFGVKGEIVSVDIMGESETGFGIHGGAHFSPNPSITLMGTIGYLSIDDVDGPEFNLGGRFKINPQFSVFADYRLTKFSADGADLDISDIRIGAGVHF